MSGLSTIEDKWEGLSKQQKGVVIIGGGLTGAAAAILAKRRTKTVAPAAAPIDAIYKGTGRTSNNTGGSLNGYAQQTPTPGIQSVPDVLTPLKQNSGHAILPGSEESQLKPGNQTTKSKTVEPLT